MSSPRKVSIQIGLPEGFENPGSTEEAEEALHDCFSVNFQEENGETGWVAQAGCLCFLQMATEAWLMGQTQQEVEALLDEHARGH